MALRKIAMSHDLVVEKKPRLRIIFRNSPQLHPLRLKFSKVLALPKEICITNGRATSQHLDVQNEFAI